MTEKYISLTAAQDQIDKDVYSTESERAYMKNLIRKTPVSDVVEVVRCKDCDMWNEWDSSGHKDLGNFVCSCAYWTREDGCVIYTKPDDFCSYGERKED